MTYRRVALSIRRRIRQRRHEVMCSAATPHARVCQARSGDPYLYQCISVLLFGNRRQCSRQKYKRKKPVEKIRAETSARYRVNLSKVPRTTLKEKGEKPNIKNINHNYKQSQVQFNCFEITVNWILIEMVTVLDVLVVRLIVY